MTASADTFPPLAEPTAAAEAAGLPVEARREHLRLTLFRKLLLSVMGIGALASVVGASQLGTLAGFTATTVNPGTTFTSGTLYMNNSVTSGTLTVSGLVPGTSSAVQQSSVTITNAGSLKASFTLTETGVTGSLLAPVLNLTIYDQTAGICLYGKTNFNAPTASTCDTLSITSPTTTTFAFNNVGSGGVAGSPITLSGTAGTGSQWAANGTESHVFVFTVQFPLLADTTTLNNLVGQTASATFQWDATQ